MLEFVYTDNVGDIIQVHSEIFGSEFPMKSYEKKKKEHKIYIFTYVYEGKQVGYSIIVEQSDINNLYAWYGGVIPEFQGKGINDKFFDFFISFAREHLYNSVTFATTNMRPHMLILGIKKGFKIFDIKKRETGEGNKIYFKYQIHPLQSQDIDFKNVENLSYSQFEKMLVEINENKSMLVRVKNVYKDEHFKRLLYALRYFSSLGNLPNVEIYLSKQQDNDKLIEEVKKVYPNTSIKLV